MSNKMSDKFMGSSKKIMDDDPEMKAALNEVMGRVADSLVRKKYVDPEKKSEKNGENSENSSS